MWGFPIELGGGGGGRWWGSAWLGWFWGGAVSPGLSPGLREAVYLFGRGVEDVADFCEIVRCEGFGVVAVAHEEASEASGALAKDGGDDVEVVLERVGGLRGVGAWGGGVGSGLVWCVCFNGERWAIPGKGRCIR